MFSYETFPLSSSPHVLGAHADWILFKLPKGDVRPNRNFRV